MQLVLVGAVILTIGILGCDSVVLSKCMVVDFMREYYMYTVFNDSGYRE